jgi:folate-binding protein YgfZ
MDASVVQEPTARLAWSQIVIRGPQGEQFLQGQLSQDLATVGRDGTWSLLLRPDSVVITSGHVRRDDEGFVMTLPRALGDAAMARLRRFRLRVDCTMSLQECDEGPFETVLDQVEAGWPGVGEFAADLAPQSFGASFVGNAVSFTKGCYTGQELVSRLDARGSSVPWRLVRVHGPDVRRIDELLNSKGPPGPQGATTIVRRDDGVVALGFAHRSLLSDGALEGVVDVAVESIA